MLLRDRGSQAAEAGAESEAPAPESIPSVPCQACGAGMRADQDWCLECGTAGPGRLGGRPGWRAAFTVVGLALLLVCGAGAAAYAALTGDAERQAQRASAGSGTPIVAPTPSVNPPAAVTPGATGPGTTAPAVPPPPGGSTPPAVVPPPPSGTPDTNTPQTGTSGTSKGTTDTTGATGDTGTTSSGPPAITIAKASNYDPNKRVGAEFGPPENAIDDDAASVWDVTTPVDEKPLGVGLVLDLDSVHTLDSLKISTSMQGFDLEVYGAKSKAIPPDILDARWDHLLNRGAYQDKQAISLKGKSKNKLRYVLLWFTQPRDIKDPRVTVRNVTINGTE